MLRQTTILLAACLAVTPRGPQDQPKSAVPVEAIGGIVDAFRTHRLVGLSEGPHGNIEGHRFRLSLIRDPRFSATVNDIVVEFGNARYQDLMDRFVRGAAVDDEALRHVWEDTTNVNPGWERPIYKEFFQAVRAVNAKLPADRQLRVLLGDPPMNGRLSTRATNCAPRGRAGPTRWTSFGAKCWRRTGGPFSSSATATSKGAAKDWA